MLQRDPDDRLAKDYQDQMKDQAGWCSGSPLPP